VTTNAGFIDVDYMNQSVEVYHQDRIVRRTGPLAAFGEYAMEVSMERVQLRRSEPLHLELMHFVDIIVNDRAPLTSPEQALEAMRLVWRIQSLVKGAGPGQTQHA
jgi:predicted dehydrogenase